MEKEKEFLQLIKSLPKKEKAVITKAFNFAKKMHAGQKRQSGDDYFTHPLAVALDLEKRFHDYELTAAALLHDTAEDCSQITVKKIYQNFGEKIGFLVDAVTKNISRYYKSDNVFKGKIGKLLWGGMKDFRALVLKIADREHNLTNLDVLVPNKQIKISFETQAVYHPLREILNYSEVKSLAEIKKNFYYFLKKEKIKDRHDFREVLFRRCFAGLNRDMYDIIYDNGEKIVWVVEDKKFFEKICQSKDFSRAVDNMKIWTDGLRFKGVFSFKKGVVINNQNIKYDILRYKA